MQQNTPDPIFVTLLKCAKPCTFCFQRWYQHRLACWRQQQGLPANSRSIMDWWRHSVTELEIEIVSRIHLRSVNSIGIPGLSRFRSEYPNVLTQKEWPGHPGQHYRTLHVISIIQIIYFSASLDSRTTLHHSPIHQTTDNYRCHGVSKLVPVTQIVLVFTNCWLFCYCEIFAYMC